MVAAVLASYYQEVVRAAFNLRPPENELNKGKECMTDKDIVQQAYEDAIRKICEVYYDAMIVAPGLPEQALADQRFQDGIRKARAVRDRALGLVP